MSRLFFAYLLERQTWIIVLFHIDGAAVDKAQLFDEVLHDRVVTMGINAQMAALLIRPVDTERPDSFFGAVPGDSVYNAVGTVVEPRAVRDLAISRLNILPMDEEERADDLPGIIDADEAVAILYVAVDQRLRRPVRRPPLIGIPVLRHVFSCKALNLHHPVKILLCCMSDVH